MPERESSAEAVETVADNAVTKKKFSDPPDEMSGSVQRRDVEFLAGKQNRVNDKNIDQLNDKIRESNDA